MFFLEKQFLDQLTPTLDEQSNIVSVADVPFTPGQILRADPQAYEDAFKRWKYGDWLPERLKRADELLNISGNAGRFKELVEATKRDNVTPFIGSGMSCPTGKPVWRTFLEKISCNASVNNNEFLALLDDGRYEEAASFILSHMPVQLFDEQLEHTFRVYSIDEISGAVRYLPTLFKRVIVTLNFDNLLEILYESQDDRFTQILAAERVRHFRNFQFREHCLVKLHGDLFEPETRVLTTNEFDRDYAAGSVMRDNLSLLFRTEKLLFLGCSLFSDRTTLLFEEIANADPDVPRHCAFLRLPQETQTQLDREHFLTSRSVFPIWYDGDHDECIEALFVKLMNEVGLL